MKRKIIITGGAGMMGTHSAFFYYKKNWSVTIVDNLYRKGSSENLKNIKKKININYYNIDISDFNKISNIIKQIKPDVILHCAGQVAVTTSVKNPRVDFNTNLLGGFNILEAVRLFSKKTKLINISTNKVYGNTRYKFLEKSKRYIFKNLVDIDENCPLDFKTPYGCSKGAVDQYFLDYSKTYGLNTTILRMSCVYGDMQFGIEDHGWVTWITLQSYFNKKIKIFGNGKQVRDLLYVGDLVELFYKISISNKKLNDVYNVGGGFKNSISILELLDNLEKKLKRKILFKKYRWRLNDQKIYITNLKKIKNSTRWKPKTSISNGLDRIILWISSNQNKIKKILKI